MYVKVRLTYFLLVLVPPDFVQISGEPSVPVDKESVYRCEARNANPVPQIQWVVNGAVINVNDNQILTQQDSISHETHFGDKKNVLSQSRHSSAGVQVTTQIHPPPSLAMTSTYGSGSIQVNIDPSAICE